MDKTEITWSTDETEKTEEIKEVSMEDALPDIDSWFYDIILKDIDPEERKKYLSPEEIEKYKDITEDLKDRFRSAVKTYKIYAYVDSPEDLRRENLYGNAVRKVSEQYAIPVDQLEEALVKEGEAYADDAYGFVSGKKGSYVCAVFTKDDKVFCCRSLNNPDYWEFPHGEKEHRYDYESMMKSLKEEIYSDFDLSCSIDYKINNRLIIKMEAELIYADDENISLAHNRECKWVSKDEIDGIKWDYVFKPIAGRVKEMLSKQEYKITELNTDNSEEIMWRDFCSEIHMYREFHRIIMEQEAVYDLGKTKWRQIRVYNQFGELIKTES